MKKITLSLFLLVAFAVLGMSAQANDVLTVALDEVALQQDEVRSDLQFPFEFLAIEYCEPGSFCLNDVHCGYGRCILGECECPALPIDC